MALPSWYAFDVILQGQGVASLEGWSTGCVGRAHLVPAAGERPPRALGLDLSLSAGMMHVPGTVLGWILPPWEGGPIRLPSCHLLIACHGEAASPVFSFLFFFWVEEASHASQTCQVQQYQQTAEGNLWGRGIHSTTHNRGSCFAIASDECLTLWQPNGPSLRSGQDPTSHGTRHMHHA